METRSTLFLRGFRKTLPFQWGVVPFAVMYATIAVNAGLPGWLTIFLSLMVFGGSSQLVFIDLLKSLGSPFQAVIGSNIVNARHLIYSATVTKKFSKFPTAWKLLLTYLLTDQVYAIYVSNENESSPWFFFGSGMCTWVIWIGFNFVGILFGQIIPESWNLGFAIPLMFMPLVFAVSKSRYAYIAAAAAIVLTYLLHNVPYGLGVMVAILGASIIAFITESRKK